MQLSATRAAGLLALVLLVSTAMRLGCAWGLVGFLSGDDVEVLESAFRSALGLAYQPFEIRNLLLPEAVVGPFLRAGSALGVSSSVAFVRLGLLPFVLLGSLGVWLVYRLALAWFDDRAAALLAASLYSLHPLFLGYGSTSLPRVAGVAAIAGAALLLSGRGHGLIRGLLAGLLVAVAFAVRYSEVVFLAPLAVLALLAGDGGRDRSIRVTGLLSGFLAGTLATVGWFDWRSWGEPFASLRSFARYTLIERRASTPSAAQPLDWYLRRIGHWLPLTLVPMLPSAPRTRKTLAGWLFVALPLLALSLIHHKSLRYLQAVLPFVSLLAAAGATVLWRRGWRKSVAVLLLVTCVLGLRGGWRWQQRKSVPAVAAARELATQLPRGRVVLSHGWAWGNRLFFGNQVEIHSLISPLRRAELEAAIAGADRVGLLARDLRLDPDLDRVLAEHGFVESRRFSWSRSPEARVYAPGPGRGDQR